MNTFFESTESQDPNTSPSLTILGLGLSFIMCTCCTLSFCLRMLIANKVKNFESITSHEDEYIHNRPNN